MFVRPQSPARARTGDRSSELEKRRLHSSRTLLWSNDVECSASAHLRRQTRWDNRDHCGRNGEFSGGAGRVRALESVSRGHLESEALRFKIFCRLYRLTIEHKKFINMNIG